MEEFRPLWAETEKKYEPFHFNLLCFATFLESIDGNVGDGFAQPSRQGGPLQTTSISPLLPSSTFEILDTLSLEILLLRTVLHIHYLL